MPLTHAERAARRAAMASAVAGGARVGDVARAYGVSVETVRIACRIAGFRAGPRPRPESRTLPILATLLNEPGLSLREVARRHGVSHQAVAQLKGAAEVAGITFPA